MPARRLPNEPAEDVLEPSAERDYLLDLCRSASAVGAGDFDGCAALAAFGEGDSVHAALVSEGLPSRALGGIERRRDGDFPSLSTQLRVTDACACDELHE